MRTTLWGGLIETLRHNLNRQQERVRIFELGRVYASLEKQPMKLGGLIYGDIQPEQWGTPARRVDFFDIKGDLDPADSRTSAEPTISVPAQTMTRALGRTDTSRESDVPILHRRR
jgi:phenylalanyl-tRNA synthetase beta chain